MSAMTVLKSCLVTWYSVEKLTSQRHPTTSTHPDPLVLHCAISGIKVKSTPEVNWGERDALHPHSACIIITASKKDAFEFETHREVDGFHNGTHGSNKFTEDSPATTDDYVYAIILSKPSIPLSHSEAGIKYDPTMSQ